MSESLGEAVLELRADVNQLKADLAKAHAESEKSNNKWAEDAKKNAGKIAAGVGIVIGVMYGVGKAIDATMGEYVKYADQVREVMRLTGMTAEESSRMIQVADDLKISTDDLTRSLQFAVRKGYDPSIEGLAKLSDEYNKLKPGQEQAAFLMEKFGKNGMVMAEAMEQGGEKLKALGAGIEANLILTQQQVDAAREWQRTQDDLNDSIEGTKIQLGIFLLPIVKNIVEWFRNGFGAFLKWGDQLRTIANLLVTNANPALRAYGEYLRWILNLLPSVGDGLDAGTRGYILMAKAAGEAGKTIEGTNEDMTSSLSFALAQAKEFGAYQDQRAPLMEQRAELLRRGYTDQSDAVKKVMDKVKELDEKHKQATLQWISDSYQMQLAADGVLDDKDMQKILDFQKNVGLLSDTEYDAAQQALALKAAIDAIPERDKKYLDFYISVYGQIPASLTGVQNQGNYQGGNYQGQIGGGHQRAAGGPIAPNSYLWNENSLSMPEVFVGGGGYVLTKDDAMAALGSMPGGGGGGGGDVHVHIGTLVADERGLAELEKRLRKIRRNEDQRRGTG